MKIISWNVNGVRACSRKGFLAFLKQQGPDILCIQETKAHIDQVDPEVSSPASYNTYWSLSSIGGYSGTATYSKTKPQSVSYGIGLEKFDREGRITITEYKDFTLLNIYFPNGAKDEVRHLFKQEFLSRLKYFLQKLIAQKKEVILVGDYNVAYLDIDVFNPKGLASTSGFLPEEREWFQSFLDIGFIDVYRYFYPDKKESYTWWSYRENARTLNRGWRIDHICVTPGLKSRLKKVTIHDKEVSSDHCPISVELT